MKDFWNKKAKDFPSPKNEKELITPKKVIKATKEFGINYNNKTVLDIGCGTGIYGSLIKNEAKEIFGLDISDKMLEVYNNYIEEKNIKNIKTLNANFKDFKDKKKFDIVFSIMTPAVNCPEDLNIVSELAKEYCVYVSFYTSRKCPIFDDILKELNIPKIKSAYYNNMKQHLIDKNFNPKEKILDHCWEQVKTIEELVDDINMKAKLANMTLAKETILEAIRKFVKGNTFNKKNITKIGVLVWKV